MTGKVNSNEYKNAKEITREEKTNSMAVYYYT